MTFLLISIGIWLGGLLAMALLVLFVCLFLEIPVGGLRPIKSFRGRLSACAFILLLGALLGMFFQSSFLSVFFYVVAAFALVSTFICLLIFFVKAHSQKGATPQLKPAALLWFTCLASVGLVYASGSVALAYRQQATRDYVGHVIPSLDEMKSHDGLFPKDLPAQAGGEKPLLAFNVYYWSDGQTFRFSYDDSTGLMDGYEFNSTDRNWRWVSY